MVVCKTKEDYEILKMLRSHGWSRDTSFQNIKKKLYNKLDKRFMFINSGYNLRPTDIQAAIASNQFKRLKFFMKTRNENRNKIIDRLKSNKKLEKSISFCANQKQSYTKLVWVSIDY